MKISQKIKSLFWIALVLAVLVLTWIGLSLAYPETNTLRYLPDRLFRILKTVMGSDPLGGAPEPVDIPWQLIVVKILVIVLIARSLLKVVEKVFREQTTQLRAAFKSGHTIVVGAGNKGSLIANDTRKQTGSSTVVIEKKTESTQINDLRRKGHLVMAGDATKPEMLKNAGCLNASHVIAFARNEQTGIQVAGQLRALQKRRKAGSPLHCHVHLDNPRLVEVFRQHGTDQDAAVRVHFFNLHRMVARRFWHQLPLSLADTLQQQQAHVRFLLAGFDQAAQILLLQGLRVFHLLQGQTCEWRIADARAHSAEEAFFALYPQAAHIAPISFVPLQDTAALVASQLADLPAGGKLVVLCATDDDRANLAMAAEILQASPTLDFPVHVRNSDSEGIPALLGGAARARLLFFGNAADFCRFELITGERQDQLAKAIHEDYLQQVLGAVSESAAYQQGWDSLNEDARDANRAQADHMLYKLLLSHKLDTFRQGGKLQFNSAEVEDLAIAEHARWAAHRYLNGWTYGSERDDARKLHPSLVGWEALSEGEKQKDRDTVLRLPHLLKGASLDL